MANADDLITPTEQEEEVNNDVVDELEPEEQEEAVQPEATATESEEPEETPPVSRREQLRIQDVLKKLQAKEESQTPQLQTKALDYQAALDADPEVVQQLETDRRQYGEAYFQQGLSQARSMQFHTRLEIDAPRVEAKYPQLDKNAADFNPVLADTVNQMYLSAVGYDKDTDTVRSADIRYADYVESLFELADEIATVKTAATSRNIATQAAQTGIRPSGTTAKMDLTKAPSQMTDEELQAVISAAIPKKS